MFVSITTKQCHITEDGDLKFYHHEKLKSHTRYTEHITYINAPHTQYIYHQCYIVYYQLTVSSNNMLLTPESMKYED